jgi:hypothetical protein
VIIVPQFILVQIEGPTGLRFNKGIANVVA